MGELNVLLFETLHSVTCACSLTSQLAIFAAEYLIVLMGLLVIILMFIGERRDRPALLIVMFTGLVAWALSDVAKYLVDSPRPFEVLNTVQTIVDRNYNSAFPSGHSAFAMALAIAMLYVDRSWGLLMMLGALLVGLSRVAIGVHWPLDIVGGFLVGALMAMVIREVWYHHVRRIPFWEKVERKISRE